MPHPSRVFGLPIVLVLACAACAPVPVASGAPPSAKTTAPPAIAPLERPTRLAIPVLPVAGVATYAGAPLADAPVAVFRLGEATPAGTSRTASDGSFLVRLEGVKAGIPLEIVALKAGHVVATVAFPRVMADGTLQAARGLYDVSQLSETTTVATGVLSHALYGMGTVTAIRDPDAMSPAIVKACNAYDKFVQGHGGNVVAAPGQTLLAIGTGIVAAGAGNLVAGTAPRRLLAADGLPSFLATLQQLVQTLRLQAGPATGYQATSLVPAVDQASAARFAYASFDGVYLGGNRSWLQEAGQATATNDLPLYSPAFVLELFQAGTPADATDKPAVAAALRYYFGESVAEMAALAAATQAIELAVQPDADPRHIDPDVASTYMGPVLAHPDGSAGEPAVIPPAAAQPIGGGGYASIPIEPIPVDVYGQIVVSDGTLITGSPEAMVNPSRPPTPTP
ncbi:MAG: hypothetical protein JWM80_4545 [Cyanobacteria bacterium RYN_339]|nr:hypothetical protein [Cyanobacteria bacterium RYN_339]